MNSDKLPVVERQGKYSAPALSKGLDIIEHLASAPEAQKKTDIARALQRSVSEIYRMLVVLEEREYVVFDAHSERYALTTKLFEVAHRYPPIRRLSSIAGDIMDQLARQTNQSVHLMILRDTHVLVIAQVDSPGNNVTSVRLGARVPLIQTASGAVLTAHLDESASVNLARQLEDNPTRLLKLYRENCEMVRRRGYCECPSMVIEGVRNISVPIHDHSGQTIAAMTIPFIKRLNHASSVSRTQVRRALLEAGENISRRLGSNASRSA